MILPRSGTQSEADTRHMTEEDMIGPKRMLQTHVLSCQGPLNRGGFKREGFPIWTCPSFFVFLVLFGTFPIFLGFSRFVSGIVRGFSRLVLFLFLGLLTAPTRNSPERVRDTIRTFPEKGGKPPGLETPGLEPPRSSFSQFMIHESYTLQPERITYINLCLGN